jgi:hypothetical protein
MTDNTLPTDSQQPEDFQRTYSLSEFVKLAIMSMPPVEGETEDERLDAAIDRIGRAFIKAETYLHRFDSPEQQAQEICEILSARGATYQIAEPGRLEAGYESALVYLKDQHSIDYKTAKGLLEAIDTLNIWLQAKREEIQKWRNEDPYPRQMLVRVEYSKLGARATFKPGPGVNVNHAEGIYLISVQNLEMFAELRTAKEAWDTRVRRLSK